MPERPETDASIGRENPGCGGDVADPGFCDQLQHNTRRSRRSIRASRLKAVAGDGSRLQTITDSSANATMLSKTVTTTSADGHTRTTQFDLDGNGSFDRTLSQVMTVNADGSTVSTGTETNADNSVRDKVVTSISADGLSTTTQVDRNGDSTFDITTTDVKVLNADGSLTETIQDVNANNALRDKTVIQREMCLTSALASGGRRLRISVDEYPGPDIPQRNILLDQKYYCDSEFSFICSWGQREFGRSGISELARVALCAAP